jgi:DeoR/GlpR family transcriptional regulator of sugar metabolism
MLARQRDQRILRRLRESGSVSAQALATMLQVSPATIRRDLDRLQREGALERVYGGAFLVEKGRAPAGDEAIESPFDEVMARDAAAKDRVGAAAAGLVADGQVVLLDIGTTTMRIARALRGRRVTVVTASLAVLDVLRDDPAADLVLLGGALRRNFQSLVGALTLDALASLRADLLFLSCTGVQPDGMVVDDITTEASVKRALLAAARSTVLVAPAAKFPGTGSLRICQLRDVGTVVTSEGADPDVLAEYRVAGGRVILG